MKRVACVLAAAVVLWCAAVQPAAAAATGRRVVVVTVDGTTLDDWMRNGGLRSVFLGGAAGLLVNRAGGDERSLEAARRAAYATLAAGRRTVEPSDASALAQALSDAGIPLFVSPSWEATLPGYHRQIEDILLPRSVTLTTAPEIGGAEGSDPLEAVGRLRDRLRPGDALIVVGAVPSQRRLEDGVWLSVAALVVAGSPHGALRSATTRREGVVALIDVAPTILSVAGAPVPASMDGRPFEVGGSRVPPDRLRSLEEDFVRAAHARRPATRAWMIASMIVLLAAVVVRGRPKLRFSVEAGLAALPFVPAALLGVPLLPAMKPAATAVVALALAAVAGVVARMLRPAAEAVAVTAAASAALVLADVLAGGPLASRSPVSYLVTGGLRFYGVGNELMGVVVAGALGAGVLLRGARQRLAARFVIPLAATFVVAVLAAPSAGAKFGAVFVAVPALAVLVLGLAERRATIGAGAAIAVFTLLVGAAIYLADRATSPAAQSHIGRAGEGGIADVLGRKIDAALGIAALSIWMQALLACALAVFLVWRFRRVELAALLALRPEVAASLKAAGVAVVLAPATNDAGLIASAVIGVATTALILAALGEEATLRRPGSQAEPGSGGSAPAPPG